MGERKFGQEAGPQKGALDGKIRDRPGLRLCRVLFQEAIGRFDIAIAAEGVGDIIPQALCYNAKT